ncbi:hypothetical protein Acr_00g0047860 [Actinidia rufa]|uniref:Transposase (putative) gypsy type domain-containing protein n=1 Tax=Actinidia rufa TaxID=165716 RepID=A0A7J0DJY1_9ERIC|nr:hypothetical protein Acr_00g0047860 [Actinidia rufa]
MIPFARPGNVAFYEADFPTGLRFPIHPIIRRILNHYKICPAQLSPNARRSVICLFVIWQYYKCHMSCDEFRCLYSFSSLPDLRWYYFKAKPDKNLLRGSPSNVKGWKKRFYFTFGDEWEFFSSIPLGEGIPRVSSNGGENTTSGDEGESYPSRGDRQGDSPSQRESVECLGVIREDIGRIARRAFLDIPDLTLLRWLGGKVQNPFSNLFPSGLSPSSDSTSESLLDSGLSPELRSNCIVLNLPFILLHSWFNIRFSCSYERQPKDDVHDHTSTKKGEVDNSKGKEAMPPPPSKRAKFNKGASNATVRTLALGGPSTSPADNLGLGALMMSSAPMAQKILKEVILPANKEKVDQFTMDELVTKSFHALGQSQLARMGEQAMKIEAELKDKSEATAWLKAEVAELTSKLDLAKKLAMEDFRSLDDFKDTVTDSATTYFGKGFEFCKRLLHHHPNLGVDLASMEMDIDLAEEEEEAKTGEKNEDNEGEANPTP